MKQKLLCGLMALVLGPAALGRTPAFYENYGVVQCPPEIPPTIDASNFINHAEFFVNFTNGNLLTLPFTTPPYETTSTLNYTNDFGAVMSCNTGFRMETYSLQSGQRQRASALYNNPEQLTEGTHANNRNVPLKTLVLHSYNPFYNRFESSVEQDPLLREFALGKDRIWFSERPLFADVTNDSYSRFAAKTHELGQPIMVLHNPAQMRALVPRTAAPTVGQSVNGDVASEFGHAEPASPAAVELLGYRPNSVQFRYDAPKPGWLMITDRWAPGWQAEVNGRS